METITSKLHEMVHSKRLCGRPSTTNHFSKDVKLYELSCIFYYSRPVYPSTSVSSYYLKFFTLKLI